MCGVTEATRGPHGLQTDIRAVVFLSAVPLCAGENAPQSMACWVEFNSLSSLTSAYCGVPTEIGNGIFRLFCFDLGGSAAVQRCVLVCMFCCIVCFVLFLHS